MNNESFNLENQLKYRIFADRVHLLNDNLIFSIPANFTCLVIVFIGLHNNLNHRYLILWFSVAMIALILHIGMYILNHLFIFTIEYYSKLLIGITLVYGALWGLTGSVLMPTDHILQQMLIIVLCIGVASGGLHTLQPNLTLSISFFILIILPLAIWLFLQQGETYLLLGMALTTYLGFIIMVSAMGYKLLRTNFELRYDNLDLVNKLVVSNKILEESETRFRSAFDSAAIGMVLVSLDGQWLKVNQSLCDIVGYTEEELLAIDFQTITHPDDLESDLNYLKQLLAGVINSYNMEKRYIHKDGRIIWILLSGSLIRSPEKKPLYFIAQIQNIDAQKIAEQELKYIAHHDALTGLGNRKELETAFVQALDYAQQHSREISILFLDLDHFKEINDTLGHKVGDLLLIEIGKRLKDIVPVATILIRQGGDEFIIALTEFASTVEVNQLAGNILKNIARPITINAHKILITASIGISLYPKDGQDLNRLIQQADKALYEVKADGRNNFKWV